MNRKMGQARPEGGFALRVTHRCGAGKRMNRYLVRCGCCERRLEIHYDDQMLEIGGVMAPIANWRELLGSLLTPAETADRCREPAAKPSSRDP